MEGVMEAGVLAARKGQQEARPLIEDRGKKRTEGALLS